MTNAIREFKLIPVDIFNSLNKTQVEKKEKIEDNENSLRSERGKNEIFFPDEESPIKNLGQAQTDSKDQLNFFGKNEIIAGQAKGYEMGTGPPIWVYESENILPENSTAFKLREAYDAYLKFLNSDLPIHLKLPLSNYYKNRYDQLRDSANYIQADEFEENSESGIINGLVKYPPNKRLLAKKILTKLSNYISWDTHGLISKKYLLTGNEKFSNIHDILKIIIYKSGGTEKDFREITSILKPALMDQSFTNLIINNKYMDFLRNEGFILGNEKRKLLQGDVNVFSRYKKIKMK